ncbi:hypothetical protein MKX01_035511 [Papaver californicum]|nr:hypothetical protein MKX01_035511 [Papaver californicum]
MDFTYLQSFSPFTSSVYPVICGVFLCFLTLGLYFKHTGQAVDCWIFLGSIPSLLLNYDRLIERRMTDSIFITELRSGYRFLVTCHPENIEYIIKTNFENFPKGENFREVFSTLGVGILNVDSDTWRLQRKLAHAGLILGEFKTLVAKTCRKMVEEQLVPLLAHVAEEGFSIDLQDLIFGRCDNYLSIGLPSNELAEGASDAQDAVLFRGIVPTFFWKLQRVLRIDENYGEFIVQKRKDLLAGVKTDDFLSLYIKALADESSVFSSLARKDNFLRDEMFNFFVAGRETTKSALTWLFWLVSITPSVEAKILEELNSVLFLKKKGKETKSRLVYLHAALSESLRLYPPLSLNRKSVAKKDIILSFYSLGRMPWIWGEDCLEFKPERWIDENGKLIVVPTSRFPAFGIGARSCLGRDTAFTQMKSVVAAVLFNFHVKVVEGHHVCLNRPSAFP